MLKHQQSESSHSATAFHFNLRRSKNELFLISLYEIDYLLKDREIAKEIKQKLPDAYKDYANVFLKIASNVVPPHHLYNYKI